MQKSMISELNISKNVTVPSRISDVDGDISQPFCSRADLAVQKLGQAPASSLVRTSSRVWSEETNHDFPCERVDGQTWMISEARNSLWKKRLAGNGIQKRAFDLLLAVILLVPVGLVVSILWVLVRLDGGPGFFAHRRVGEGGRIFHCWKLRTMQIDAEARLQEVLAADPNAALEWAQARKLAEDPRITVIGAFLRETSLDELPQIWNVLRGDMSFVGPRPVVAAELKRYGFSDWAYLCGKPGITGVWQVSGRNEVSYSARVRMDVKYRLDQSLWLDVKLILRTAVEIIRCSGK